MSATKNVCEWCKKSFVSRYTLANHQRTAKYCIKLRGGTISYEHPCEWCKKGFNLKPSLVKHQRTCSTKTSSKEEFLEKESVRLKKENALVKEENVTLTEKLLSAKEELRDIRAQVALLRIEVARKETYAEGLKEGVIMAPAKTQKTVNNVHPKLVNLPVDKVPPFTEKLVQARIDDGKFTEELFRRGVPGLVSFVSDLITFEDGDGTRQLSYACTDSSRNRFHRLVESREWQEDNGAKFLSNVMELLREPVSEHFRSYLERRRACQEDDDITLNFCNELIKRTEPIYQGIVYDGEARQELLSSTRGMIRNVASV